MAASDEVTAYFTRYLRNKESCRQGRILLNETAFFVTIQPHPKGFIGITVAHDPREARRLYCKRDGFVGYSLVIVFVFGKIFSEFFYSSNHCISLIICSNSVCTRSSLSFLNIKYKDNLSTNPLSDNKSGL